MCLTCNPYCGRCHPPRKRRPVFCLDCGRENTFDDGDLERSVCSFCGGELPVMRTQPTVRCSYSGLLCSDPCGRSRERQADGVFKECDRRVPPLDAKTFAQGLRKGPHEKAPSRRAGARTPVYNEAAVKRKSPEPIHARGVSARDR